ncbi:MAG: DUF4388 domain-containing protein [Cyanobacteria bacterium]|nr:DUF4388 domain-containing protein [Cyanobacteriota bacterium]
MFEGDLQDLSLPGLLQLLAGESSKSYRLKIRKGGQVGDMLICEGELLAATYGILEGLDALSEFLNWSEGEFTIERVSSRFKETTGTNIRLKLDQPGSFTDQCAFLQESAVGLNTEIVPSINFGTPEWQKALSVQPLKKEDYAIIGWITDGRTMRQAMREFNFDLITSIGILYRLLITHSVEIVRATYRLEGTEDKEDVHEKAQGELAKYSQQKLPGTVEYKAIDIASGETRPLRPAAGSEKAQAVRKTEEMVPVAFADVTAKRKAKKTADMESPGSPKRPSDTQDLPAMDMETATALKEEAAAAAVTKQEFEVSNVVMPSPIKPVGEFDERRTDPLPLVSIDIERFLNSRFSLTKIGSLALANPELDELLRKVLLDVESERTLVLVLTDSSCSDATVLETYRYCLDRGYIEHTDPVIGLTVDLLLDKIELEQYLLQRRRITGDQLRDLSQIATRQGIPVVRLLVATGFVLPDDMERLLQEQRRFTR